MDDDPKDLRTVKTTLEAEDFNVFAAGGGAQALALVKSERFSPVLLDIQMSRLLRYDLARMLRQKFDWSAKIIFVSIVPQDKADLAADAFVQKPFSHETVMITVKAVMDKR